MPQDASPDTASFLRQIRGTSGEFASLLYLAAALRDRAKSSPMTGPPSEEQLQTINLLKTRIAELSRFSEKRMYRAAVKLNQIASALKGQQPAADVAQRVEPIRQLLQEQINHSRRTVQVGMQAVNDLDSLAGMAPVTSAVKSAPKTPPKKTARKAGRAAKASKPLAAKRPKKTAARKRATRSTKTTAAEPGGGTSAGT